MITPIGVVVTASTARRMGAAANAAVLVVPCHRVTHKGGSTGGYRCVLAINEALLAAETAARTP